MAKKLILIHGNGGGTGNDTWFPYIKSSLEKDGMSVFAPTFPDNDLARESYWIPFLKTLHPDHDTIIVGHSSGAIAAMRFAEENKILGSVLVGTYYTDLHDEKEKKSEYFDRPWNWNAIKKNQQWVIEFASTDDPWIHISEPQFIHEKLESEYYEYTNKGHFMTKEFPELLEVLKKKLNLI